MKLSAIADRVIELARAADKEDAQLRRRHRVPDHFTLETPFSEEFRAYEAASKPRREELDRYLAAQSEDVVRRLEALMYFGRGDGGDDLLKLYREVSEAFESKEDCIRQMLEKSPLADYLEEGISRATVAGIHLDAWS
jgi:hypothetical protein